MPNWVMSLYNTTTHGWTTEANTLHTAILELVKTLVARNDKTYHFISRECVCSREREREREREEEFSRDREIMAKAKRRQLHFDQEEASLLQLACQLHGSH
jgi:hypothetical protein